MTHGKRITRVTVAPKGASIFDQTVMQDEIENEGAGEYVVVISNEGRARPGVIGINPDEWPLLREAIDEMVARCH